MLIERPSYSKKANAKSALDFGWLSLPESSYPTTTFSQTDTSLLQEATCNEQQLPT